MERVHDLLHGAIDLHTHTAPSLAPRSVDSWQLLQLAAAAGMRGVLIKDHHFPTMQQAWLANRHAGVDDCRLYGSLTLNHTVGGLNLDAVDAAIRFGTALICLPTISAANHVVYRQRIGNAAHPRDPLSTASASVAAGAVTTGAPIGLMDTSGRATPAVREILRRAAAADVAVATGHCSLEEAGAVVAAARELDCRKVVLTHFPGYTTTQINALRRVVDAGPCFVELCWEMTVRDLPPAYQVLPSQIATYIRAFGPERVVLSTDFGHARLPDPVEGMRTILRMLIAEGWDDASIRTMTTHNPAWLLGADQSTSPDRR